MCGRIAHCGRGRSFGFLPKGIEWVAGAKARFYRRCNSGESARKNQPTRARTPLCGILRENRRCAHWFLNKGSLRICLSKAWRTIMPNSSGEPESTGAQAEASNREDLDKADSRRLSEEEETASKEPSMAAEAPARSQDWWSATPPPAEWAQPAANDQTADVDVSKESATADVFFCGQSSFFPLNRALQAIAKEKLTGSLRSFWNQEPIDLLAQNGEILFA